MKNVDRKLRIQEMLHAAVAEVVRNEVSEPAVQYCTITEIDVSRDLANARVKFLCHGDVDPTKAEKALNRAAGYIRHCLFNKVTLRRLPQFRFVYDRGLEEGAKLSLSLQQENQSETDAETSPDTDVERHE